MLINLTPHTIKLKKLNREIVEIPSHDIVRVSEVVKEVGVLEGIKVIEKTFSDVSEEHIKIIKKYLVNNENLLLVSCVTLERGIYRRPRANSDRL